MNEPTKTNAEVVEEIETRFRKMAREYAEKEPRLIAWKAAGNKLPEVYR